MIKVGDVVPADVSVAEAFVYPTLADLKGVA